MAFLQRVVNGGGVVTREYGIASRRIDLLVTWPFVNADGQREVQREAIELEVWRDGRKDPLDEGLRQIDGYLDRLGLTEGTLILFDRRSAAAPIEERTREESARTPTGKPVRVLRASVVEHRTVRVTRVDPRRVTLQAGGFVRGRRPRARGAGAPGRVLPFLSSVRTDDLPQLRFLLWSRVTWP